MTTAATIANACRTMQRKGYRMHHLSIITVLAGKQDPIHTPEIEEKTAVSRQTINLALREMQAHGYVSTIEAGRGGASVKGTQAWLTPKGAALAKQLTGGHAEQPQS